MKVEYNLSVSPVENTDEAIRDAGRVLRARYRDAQQGVGRAADCHGPLDVRVHGDPMSAQTRYPMHTGPVIVTARWEEDAE
jgi:hypothetical protein